MAQTRIRSLRVQASQSADLSFNMPGVVAWQNYNHSAQSGPAYIGNSVSAYDLSGIYARLGEINATDDGTLLFDSKYLDSTVRGSSLFALRNASLGASLDKMIQQRRAAWRDRFKYSAEVQQILSQHVPALITHLEQMRATGLARHNAIDTAYGMGGVQKTVITETTAPASTSITKVNPVTTISSELDQNGGPKISPITTEVLQVANGGETPVQRQRTPRTAGIPATLQAGNWVPASTTFNTQTVETTVSGTQRMISELQAYSHPKYENTFSYHQAMAGILPELIRQRTVETKLGQISNVMASELAAIDLDIRAAQVNFAHTYLTSPLDGVITAIFKDVGENVEPGEPVLRVENDRVIFFLGRVQHQGMLWIGRGVELTLKSVFEDGKSQTIQGQLIGLRGHEADNDEWDVVIKANNPIVGPRRLLPLGYQVDPDTDLFKPL